MNVTVDSVPEGALRCFEVSGPRYTTFPTADRFVEAYTADHHIQALRQRRSGLANRFMPLSLYVHIPFCESLCYFCACNKIITKRHDHAAAYLGYLEREVQLHIEHVGSGQNISQLYLGGEVPHFSPMASCGPWCPCCGATSNFQQLETTPLRSIPERWPSNAWMF